MIIIIIITVKITNYKTVYMKCKIHMKDMLLNDPAINYQTNDKILEWSEKWKKKKKKYIDK